MVIIMWWFFSKRKTDVAIDVAKVSKAIKNNDLKQIKECINSKNVNHECAGGFYPIHLAVLYNRLEIAKYLLDQGANCKTLTNGVDFPLLLAVRASNLEMVNLLLEYKGAVETINWHSVAKGDTALSFAFVSGDEEIAKLLVTKGAKVLESYALAHGELIRRQEFLDHLKDVVTKQTTHDLVQKIQHNDEVSVIGEDDLSTLEAA